MVKHSSPPGQVAPVHNPLDATAEVETRKLWGTEALFGPFPGLHTSVYNPGFAEGVNKQTGKSQVSPESCWYVAKRERGA